MDKKKEYDEICGGVEFKQIDWAKANKERELYREQAKRVIKEQNKKKKKAI